MVVAPIDGEILRILVESHGACLIIDNGHISAAVNRGFAEAGSGHRYVGWIGDDDLLYPNSLYLSSSLLERQANGVVAFGCCDYIDLSGRLLFTRRPPPGAKWWLQFVPGLIKQEACLFRKDAVIEIGGLDDSLRYAMDLDLLLRLRQLGTFVRAEATLAAFCWHPGSITIANRDASVAEAQRVQRQGARGLARLINPVLQPLSRYLLLAMSDHVNSRHMRGV